MRLGLIGVAIAHLPDDRWNIALLLIPFVLVAQAEAVRLTLLALVGQGLLTGRDVLNVEAGPLAVVLSVASAAATCGAALGLPARSLPRIPRPPPPPLGLTRNGETKWRRESHPLNGSTSPLRILAV